MSVIEPEANVPLMASTSWLTSENVPPLIARPNGLEEQPDNGWWSTTACQTADERPLCHRRRDLDALNGVAARAPPWD